MSFDLKKSFIVSLWPHPVCLNPTFLILFSAVWPTMGNSNKSLSRDRNFLSFSHCVDRTRRDLRSSYY